ncbi:MAG: OmpH family outer membrane protein [Bacteroidales bacterium]|jgi:outer membrane protein|nr:OmpH family outer membrane protein [Bacteroidales bacterium]
MKRLTLLSIVIAVICLSCNRRQAETESPAVQPPERENGLIAHVADESIVYVNIDTLMRHYQMATDLTDELSEKMKKLDAELNNKQRKFQQNVADFQNKANKGLETRAKLTEMQQQLASDEQSLMQLSEQYRLELSEDQSVMQRQVLQAIMDYLKEYNSSKGYKYILANTFPGNILYAAPELDITSSVLEGINAKYRSEHAAKK